MRGCVAIGSMVIALAVLSVAGCSKGMPKPTTQNLGEAAEKGNLVVVDNLIGHGANVNAKDAKGMTPLDHAIVGNSANSMKVVNMLLRHGANPNIPDAKGETAVALAQRVHNRRALRALGE